MRWAVGSGLLLLGLLLVDAPASSAQPVTPTTPPPSAPSTSGGSTQAPTAPAPASSTSTSALLPAAGAADGSTSGLPTLGEGFPWITVGAVILIAGLVGGRLRRASRR
ncbi:MAG: hypothetical protein JOZ04_03350 [Acidimicrobiia bacterium]|nr:hypothetical protein [Acidimicrobiia bacterium]